MKPERPFFYIWQSYFFKEAVKVFCLFIFTFGFLYTLIDYSANLQVFRESSFKLSLIGKYYLVNLIVEANILVPAALLLATIKVLTAANVRKELIALMAGGISRKKILVPFLLLAFLCTIFLYLNAQYFIPQSKQMLKEIGGNKISRSALNTIYLNDSSKIIYQSYDSKNARYFDLFWIRSANDIYHMKYLYDQLPIPLGTFVDHINADSSGVRKGISYPEKLFSEMNLSGQLTQDRKKVLIANLSFSQLYKKLGNHQSGPYVAAFIYKLIVPLICFLVVLAPAPLCMRYDRNLSIFSIYGIAIFGFIAFYTLMQSAFILTSSSSLPPLWPILTPMGLAFFFSGIGIAKKL